MPIQSKPVTGKDKFDSTWFYCQRSGHSSAKCFQRVGDNKREGSSLNTKEVPLRQKAAKLESTISRHKASPSFRAVTERSTDCVTYKTSSHSADDCLAVAKICKWQPWSGRGNFQSGEKERKPKKNETETGKLGEGL